ncbi:MAG: dienelactone hydrolase family protein, partial [Alphaproteobacteria bacterium]|nr:dienelactone hydrolase family protein [Alphaproteobacteria bacterium]
RNCMTNPDLRAGVAWYGRLEKLKTLAAELRVPVLGLYGALDQGIPQADVQQMAAGIAQAHKTGSSIHVYPDAGHGFHADYRDSYNAHDAADGWARMLAHFRAHGVD